MMTIRPQIVRLFWNDWSRNHITKHAVTPEEAEEVVVGTAVARETSKGRLQLIGPTLTGKSGSTSSNKKVICIDERDKVNH